MNDNLAGAPAPIQPQPKVTEAMIEAGAMAALRYNGCHRKDAKPDDSDRGLAESVLRAALSGAAPTAQPELTAALDSAIAGLDYFLTNKEERRFIEGTRAELSKARAMLGAAPTEAVQQPEPQPPSEVLVLLMENGDGQSPSVALARNRAELLEQVKVAVWGEPNPADTTNDAGDDMAEGMTDTLLETGVMTFEGDPPLRLIRIPVEGWFSSTGHGAAAVGGVPWWTMCMCGQPWTLNTVHREHSPCWLAPDPKEGLVHSAAPQNEQGSQSGSQGDASAAPGGEGSDSTAVSDGGQSNG